MDIKDSFELLEKLNHKRSLTRSLTLSAVSVTYISCSFSPNVLFPLTLSAVSVTYISYSFSLNLSAVSVTYISYSFSLTLSAVSVTYISYSFSLTLSAVSVTYISCSFSPYSICSKCYLHIMFFFPLLYLQ